MPPGREEFASSSLANFNYGLIRRSTYSERATRLYAGIYLIGEKHNVVGQFGISPVTLSMGP